MISNRTAEGKVYYTEQKFNLNPKAKRLGRWEVAEVDMLRFSLGLTSVKHYK